MKKRLLFAALLAGMFHVNGQNYYMESPEGFGAAATGGGSATPITVTTYTALKTNIETAGPKVILVSGTITIPEGQQISKVVTDKTILGLPGAKLVNNSQTQSGSGILNLKNGSNNVIIRNLIFEGPGAYDVDGRDNLTADGCTNLWVDHCEFQDGVDGNFDIKGNSDDVTVSWCKFTYLKPAVPGGPGGSNDHRFSNLVGSSSTNAPVDGHYSVTFQNCFWADGVKARMPRARNAELHILNCYVNTDVSSSTALGLGGGINDLTCYVENTDFANVGNVYQNASSDGGTVSLVFDNCLNGESNVGTVTAPTYSYTVIEVEDVAEVISNESCGAGATLDITETGEISSSCDNLGLQDLESIGVKVYPTIVEDMCYIEFPSKLKGNVSVEIFTVTGQKLYTLPNTHEMDGLERYALDLSQFSEGMYLCLLRINGQTESFRLMKR